MCHGSHVPSPGEQTLLGSPEKSMNKNKPILQPKFIFTNGKWEPVSSSAGSSDCGSDGESEKSPSPINKLEIKSRRPQIIITTAMKPCEFDNPHIDWDPTIRTTENWDLSDVVSDFFLNRHPTEFFRARRKARSSLKINKGPAFFS